jgi:hypothetical protein
MQLLSFLQTGFARSLKHNLQELWIKKAILVCPKIGQDSPQFEQERASQYLLLGKIHISASLNQIKHALYRVLADRPIRVFLDWVHVHTVSKGQ